MTKESKGVDFQKYKNNLYDHENDPTLYFIQVAIYYIQCILSNVTVLFCVSSLGLGIDCVRCDHRLGLWTYSTCFLFVVLVQFVKKGLSVDFFLRLINRSTRILCPIDSFLIPRVYFRFISK